MLTIQLKFELDFFTTARGKYVKKSLLYNRKIKHL